MNCLNCDKKLRSKKVNYDYSHKSFQGVIIECREYHCKACNKAYTDLGDNHDINKQICEILLTQGILNRNQLGYVFKQILNMTVFQVAKRIGTSPQHLNDVIKFKKILSQLISDQICELIYIEFKRPSIVID